MSVRLSVCLSVIAERSPILLVLEIKLTKERRWSDRLGGGGVQRPVRCIDELKKTGARSARARTRGQNPLVL